MSRRLSFIKPSTANYHHNLSSHTTPSPDYCSLPCYQKLSLHHRLRLLSLYTELFRSLTAHLYLNMTRRSHTRPTSSSLFVEVPPKTPTRSRYSSSSNSYGFKAPVYNHATSSTTFQKTPPKDASKVSLFDLVGLLWLPIPGIYPSSSPELEHR